MATNHHITLEAVRKASVGVPFCAATLREIRDALGMKDRQSIAVKAGTRRIDAHCGNDTRKPVKRFEIGLSAMPEG
jgi:hypothetical protein